MGKYITKVRIFILMGIMLLVFVFIPFRTSLVFYEVNTNNVRAYLPIQAEDTFQVIFTHSIHLTDVVEKYQVLPDKDIKQYEFVFEEYGIGMPSNAGEGERFVSEDGKYYIKDMNLIFPSINIRNGKTVSEHRLAWGPHEEHRVFFNDYFEPGESLTMKVSKLSLWQLLRGVTIRD